MPQQPRRFQSFMRFRTRELLQSWRSPSDFKSRIRPDLVFRQIVAYERANISRTEGVGPGKTVESGSELCLCRHLPRTLDPVRSLWTVSGVVLTAHRCKTRRQGDFASLKSPVSCVDVKGGFMNPLERQSSSSQRSVPGWLPRSGNQT